MYVLILFYGFILDLRISQFRNKTLFVNPFSTISGVCLNASLSLFIFTMSGNESWSSVYQFSVHLQTHLVIREEGELEWSCKEFVRPTLEDRMSGSIIGSWDK